MEILKLKPKVKGLRTVRNVLLLLGIPYKRRADFWLTNEINLPYLYQDFQVKARQLKARLHPDVGGDAEEFVKFNVACAMTTRAFARHGVGGRTPATEREAIHERNEAVRKSYVHRH